MVSGDVTNNGACAMAKGDHRLLTAKIYRGALVAAMPRYGLGVLFQQPARESERLGLTFFSTTPVRFGKPTEFDPVRLIQM